MFIFLLWHGSLTHEMSIAAVLERLERMQRGVRRVRGVSERICHHSELVPFPSYSIF